MNFLQLSVITAAVHPCFVWPTQRHLVLLVVEPLRLNVYCWYSSTVRPLCDCIKVTERNVIFNIYIRHQINQTQFIILLCGLYHFSNTAISHLMESTAGKGSTLKMIFYNRMTTRLSPASLASVPINKSRYSIHTFIWYVG